jgi:hypothetical protein
VWALVGLPLRGRSNGADLASICTSLLLRLTDAERAAAELTAKQAFVVAVVAAVGTRRTGRTLTLNLVFDALAKRWSPKFRAARPATTSWDMRPATITAARRELLAAGVDLTRLWGVVRGGIPGIYRTQIAGGEGHARGRRVSVRGKSLRYREYVQALDGYRRQRPRRRLLLAREPTPSLRIKKEVAGEVAHEVMHVGEKTRAVIQMLEQTRLFLVVAEVRRDATRLTRAVREHEWPRVLKAWTAAEPKTDGAVFQERRRDFVKAHRALHAKHLSLLGHRDQARAVDRWITRVKQFIDSEGHLEIKTAYYKHRTRRFQARSLWPTEVSSKEERDRVLIADAEEGGVVSVDGGGRRWKTIGGPAIFAETSLRGRWFKVRASGYDGEPGFTDDFAGDRRPLVGVDCSSSMTQILCIALGQRESETEVTIHSFKDGLVAAIDVVHDAHVGFTRPDGVTRAQKRQVVGKLTNRMYGAQYSAIADTIYRDPITYGAEWGDAANIEAFVERGAPLDDRVALLKTLQDEYLTVCQALAEAAYQRDPRAGVVFHDPYDGEEFRWHRPVRKRRKISNSAAPLFASVPVGERNAVGYPAKLKGPGGLKNLIAPGLIHALDASYAAHVVTALHERGIRDVVAIHDCFLVASDAAPALDDATIAAAEPWFRGLGPFYDVFEDYLGDDAVHGPTVRRWREVWTRRVAAGDWPRFLMKPETTLNIVRR